MKTQYFLPMGDPDFLCYPYYSLPNAIIKANSKERYSDFLCSKYINCYFRADSSKYKFVLCATNPWFDAENIMKFQEIKYLRDTLRLEGINLVDIIKKCLICNCYVYGQFNRSYVEKVSYNVTEYCVTGFDDAMGAFSVYYIDSQNVFKQIFVDYSTFLDAIMDVPALLIHLWVWRYNGVNFDDSINDMVTEFDDYINSTVTKVIPTPDKIYGLDSIKALADYFGECVENKTELYKPYVDKYLLHKKYMADRVRNLSLKGFVSSVLISNAEAVYAIAREVSEWCNKYNENYDQIPGKMIYQKICDSVNIEVEYLQGVIEDIRNIAHA